MMKLFKKLSQKRIEREMQKKFPDPLIVCPVAKNCAHVDGYLCEPKKCSTMKEWKVES